MVELIFVVIVAGWMVLDAVREALMFRQEAERRRTKAELWRTMLARDPESPSSYERLGDALREADELGEAVQCYEEAIRRRDARRTASGTGWTDDGGSLENKLRLARFAYEAETDPTKHGQTLATRPQVCRSCGNLNGSQDTACTTCGALMPTDGFWDTLQRQGLRTEILRETGGIVGKLAIVVLVVCLATAVPWEIRGVLLISAVIVVPIHFLRKIGGK